LSVSDPPIGIHDGARERDALWKRRIAMERSLERHYAANRGALISKARVPKMLLQVLGLWNRGLRNALSPRMRRLRIACPPLSDHLDGFRILHVADFHFNAAIPEFPPIVRDLLSEVEADLCVLTGDFRFAQQGAYDHVFPAMETVLSGVRARYGTFAVLGNHDISALVEPFEAMGVNVLINEPHELAIEGGSLWLAGVDDQHRFRCHDIRLATTGIPRDAFTLLLAHSPELALEAPNYGIDLYLCGHTHWGQVRFPLIGALLYNSRCPRRFCKGRWRNGTMEGYTTAGVGTTDLPVRYNCPPEACLIELVRG